MSHESCYSDEKWEVATRAFEIGTGFSDPSEFFASHKSAARKESICVNLRESPVDYA